MHAPKRFMSAGHREAIAGIVEGVLGSSDSVLLSGAAGAGKTIVLNVVAAELALASARVVQATASVARPMGLRDFTAQVAGPPREEGDTDLERAFEALTVPAGDGGRIVLVIDGAEALLPETLRYIQLACKAQPRLQVIFSGRPEFADHLKDSEFCFLRGRPVRTLALPVLSDEEATGFIEHRLRAAGLPGGEVIAGDALGTLLRHAQGNPGRIAAVLDRALAAQSWGQHDAAPSMRPGEPARAESGAALADFADAAQASISDERPAATPTRSADRHRLRPPAWALIWMGLIAEVGLYTATITGTEPAQRTQLAAVMRPQPITRGGAVGALGDPRQLPKGAGQAGTIPAETLPEPEARVTAAALPPLRQAMSDSPGAIPARPDPTAPVQPAPGQAEMAAPQTPDEAAASPEPATPVRALGDVGPAPAAAGSEQTRVAASATPATTASLPEPPASQSAAVPAETAVLPPARGAGGGGVGDAAPSIAASEPDGSSPGPASARPNAPSEGTRDGRPMPLPPLSSTAGQLASVSSMPLGSVSASPRGVQKPFRRGGSKHLASSVEHRWLKWTGQDRASPLPLALTSPPTMASMGRPASGYIGVYATGADGMRGFRAGP